MDAVERYCVASEARDIDGLVATLADDPRLVSPISGRMVVLADARVAGLRMTDAMVFELAEDGRIETFRPHLRPWLALTVFAALLGPRVLLRPGVVRRALTS